MVAQSSHTNTEVTGKVVRVNQNGFQLAGETGWFNISRYATGVAVPAIGDMVRVALDRSGYVRRVESHPIAPAPSAADRGFRERLAAEVPPDVGAAEPPAGPPVSRDRVVTRLAVLNTATSILGSGARAVEPDAVLELAARLEAWATRTEVRS